MAQKRKPIKLMKKSHSVLLFVACTLVLVGAIAALIYLGGDMM